MSRIITPQFSEGEINYPDLPAVDFTSCGGKAPEVLTPRNAGASDPMPKADVVIITWTDDEWSAFDHIFINSSSSRSHDDNSWMDDWIDYSRNTISDLRYWGAYQLVSIGAKKVLLFHSQCHLAHWPYESGLSQMVQELLNATGEKAVYSIGTAGGSVVNENLGDVVITCAAHIITTLSDNTENYNNQTFTCPTAVTVTALNGTVQDKLYYALSNRVNDTFLGQLLNKLHSNTKLPSPGIYTLGDLVNAPLMPDNLGNPKNLDAGSKPLLTTDYYYISPNGNSSPYCILEMDDAVIAYQAKSMGVDFGFVRNVSDTFVPVKTQGGQSIPADVRNAWSSLVFETCGFYTSFNGALAMWAILAG